MTSIDVKVTRANAPNNWATSPDLGIAMVDVDAAQVTTVMAAITAMEAIPCFMGFPSCGWAG